MDEQGNWVVNDGYAKIYVRADADATVKAYYNSTTKEYLHVFYLKKGSTAEKVITYTVDKDHVCIYATIEGKIAANSIVTFTAGEKTATVKLGKLSSSDMAFTYPAAERGKTYTGTLGDITLDGFGTTKIGASDKTYVLNGDKLIIGDGEYAMTLTEATEEGGKGTYVVLEKDAYAGTYVIYNNYEETKNYTIILDGYGTITLKGKSSSVVGTYTVSGTTITVAKCSSYNGEWTILAGHDGKAMTMTKYGKKYDLVLNTYYPAGIESAIANLLGKWQDAAGNKITVYWWDAASTYAIDGFGATTLRLTPYWDGSVLLCAGWSDTCSDYAGSKATLLISRDGETLVVSHTCQRKDEYDEPESVAVRVTYTAAAEEPFAFEEGLRGNWKTEDGAYKLVIGETTLTLNGAEATDIAYDSTTGTYTFKANGTSYEIFSYFGAWFVGVTGGESAQLVADTVEETLDAFAGTWKTSGFSTLVIDGKGNYTLGDVSGTYTIGADGVATVADPTIHGFDSDPMTFTLKDGKLVVDYYYDYTATSKTLEKQA